jgi:hypothetical protein
MSQRRQIPTRTPFELGVFRAGEKREAREEIEGVL